MRVTWQSERTGIENKWFALTGRIVAVQVEVDGDLHIALGDVKYRQKGRGVRFAKPFSVGRERDSPLHIRSTRELTINQKPIITVIGKAFWDVWSL